MISLGLAGPPVDSLEAQYHAAREVYRVAKYHAEDELFEAEEALTAAKELGDPEPVVAALEAKLEQTKRENQRRLAEARAALNHVESAIDERNEALRKVHFEKREIWEAAGRALFEKEAAEDALAYVAKLKAEVQQEFADRVERAVTAGMQAFEGDRTQVATFLRLARGRVELFRTPSNDTYAFIPVHGHVECWPSGDLGPWLKREFYRETGRTPSAQAVSDALGMLTSIARFDGPVHEVYLRVACLDDVVYIDLGDPDWRVVKVSAAGWEVLDRSPVAFRRSHGMRALPEPEPGGSLAELWPFVNIAHRDRPLVAGLLASWLSGRGPYAIACLIGPEGSAKTFTSRVLRALIDPSAALGRGVPKEERELAVAAHNNWLLTIDNVSFIPEWLSDVMCRITSESGFAIRELYTDRREVVFENGRPQLINGIEDPVDRDDLRGRTVFLFPPILEDAEAEADLWRAFEGVQARILGALLDLVAAALRNLPKTTLPETPRMADFVRFGVAAEIPGFYEAYFENRAEAIERGIEGNLLADGIKHIANGTPWGDGGVSSYFQPRTPPLPEPKDGVWEGTAEQLLQWLNDHVPVAVPKTWPRTPRVLSQRLRRLVRSLRHVGVVVEFDWPLGSGAAKQRGIRIRRKETSE